MKKTVRFLAVFIVSLSVLTGCGSSVEKPKGTYSHGDVSFKFSGDSVTVTEGESSIKSSYTIDEEGKIVFELEGDEVEATYDAESDDISFYGTTYRK